MIKRIFEFAVKKVCDTCDGVDLVIAPITAASEHYAAEFTVSHTITQDQMIAVACFGEGESWIDVTNNSEGCTVHFRRYI